MPSSRSLFLACLLASIAGAQTISNVPAPILGFTDISGSGTALLNQGDDSDGGFVTTIGNGLFAAGNVLMASNGFAVSGASALGYSNCCGQSGITPSTDATAIDFSYGTAAQVLLPFWDDLICLGSGYPTYNLNNTTLYWQEFSGVLIMQWENIEHYGYSGSGTIRFQIQVFQNGGCAADTVQFLYTDTTFSAGNFANDGGAAEIGYISGAAGNYQWSYATTGSVTAGTCLTLTKPPPFGLAFSSPLGNGSLRADMCAGPPSGNYFLAVTLNVGNFPAGWLYGIDIPYSELATELSFGYPFQGSMTGSGTATIGPFTGLPSGLTLFSVAFAGPPATLPTLHTGPQFYVVP